LAVRRLPDDVPLPLFENRHRRASNPTRMRVPLPLMPLPEAGGRRLSDHPAVAERPSDGISAADVCEGGASSPVRASVMPMTKSMCACAGVVLVRQRPGSAKGVVFMTLEDETGHRQYRGLAEGDGKTSARR